MLLPLIHVISYDLFKICRQLFTKRQAIVHSYGQEIGEVREDDAMAVAEKALESEQKKRKRNTNETIQSKKQRAEPECPPLPAGAQISFVGEDSIAFVKFASSSQKRKLNIRKK